MTSAQPLRWLLGSTAAAVTAQGIVAAVAPLLAASLTRDPVTVGLVAACAWLPWLLIGLPAGVYVERWVKRRVMVTTDLLRAVLLAAFAALVIWHGGTVASLAATVFLIGVGSCFFDPAAQAEIPELVDRDSTRLAGANATYWTIDALARTLVGSSLGAVAFGLNAGAPFAIAAALLGVSAAMLTGLPVRRATSRSGSSSMAADLRDGLAELWRVRALRRNAALMATYNLWWNVAFATLILLLLSRFDLASWAWGALVSSMAVGGIAGGQWARSRPGLSVERAYGLGLIVQALGWVLVVAAPEWWIAFPGMIGIGAASTAVSAVAGSTIQLAASPDRLARVTSGIRLLGIGAAAVGSSVSGPIAAAGGLAAPALIAAGALFVSGLLALRLR